MGESLSLAGWDQLGLLQHGLVGSGRCEDDNVGASSWEVREPTALTLHTEQGFYRSWALKQERML